MEEAGIEELLKRLDVATKQAKAAYQDIKAATKEAREVLHEVRDRQWAENRVERLVRETLAEYQRDTGKAREEAVEKVRRSFEELGNLYRYGVSQPDPEADLAELAEQWRRQWVAVAVTEVLGRGVDG